MANRTRTSEKSAASLAYDFLHDSIIGMKLKPGQPLNLEELSEHLKVSRSPLRDAVIRLEHEGLITSLPHKGTLVSKINLKQANEECFLRITIEEEIYSLFSDLCNERDISRLRDYIKTQEKVIQDHDIRIFLKQDDEFHKYLYLRTDKEFSFNLLQNSIGHYNRLRLLTCTENRVVSSSIQEHKDMVGLFLKKDKDALKKAVRDHVMKVDNDKLELRSKYPELFEGDLKANEPAENIFTKDFLSQLK
ncbi:MAG: GntR family transcriptional regulator [Hungatella sp.]|jgi:DNA-binding GntR family transcriptional regulator|nr:GntR family transcriptional regulator [Hungatella sp.]